MRPNLRLSWLVGGQLAAKMGKLTLLEGQKGTKLELRGALGGAQRGPKRVQKGTRDNGYAARVLQRV